MTSIDTIDPTNRNAVFVPKPRKPRKIIKGTRAVQRDVVPGGYELCEQCADRIKFVAKDHLRMILCNVYEVDASTGLPRWHHLERYHPKCYDEAGQLHGPIADRESSRDKAKRLVEAEVSRRKKR